MNKTFLLAAVLAALVAAQSDEEKAEKLAAQA